MRNWTICAWIIAFALIGIDFLLHRPPRAKQFLVRQLEILGRRQKAPYQLVLFDPITDTKHVITESPDPILDFPIYSAALHKVFFVVRSTSGLELKSVNLDGSEGKDECPLEPHAQDFALSPDGKSLMYIVQSKSSGEKASRLMLRHIGIGRVQTIAAFPQETKIGEPQWCPAPKNVILWIDSGKHAKLFETSTAGEVSGQPMIQYPGHQRRPKWSSDGRHLLFLSDHVEHGPYSWVVCDPKARRVVASSRDPQTFSEYAIWSSPSHLLQVTENEDEFNCSLVSLNGQEGNLRFSTSGIRPVAVISFASVP